MPNKQFPSIPEPSRSIDGMFETVRVLKELAEVITGQRKNSSPLATGSDLNLLLVDLLNADNVWNGGNTFNGAFAVKTLGVGAQNNANTVVELGYIGGANTVVGIDFHTSAVAVDYDFRILASGNGGVLGTGTLTFAGANIDLGTTKLSMNGGGLVFGVNSLGAGPSADLSKHIALYGTTYGFNISNGTLGYVVPTTGIHQFTVNNVPVGEFSATALNLPVGQIIFPAAQAASAGANTLDDYEEGTWVPALSIGGSAAGITYTVQNGAYTKIGRLVHVQGRIVLSNKGATAGVVLITGLPFVINATYFGPGSLAYGTAFAGLTGHLSVYANAGGTAIVIMMWGATGVAQLANTQLTNTTDMIFSATYIV